MKIDSYELVKMYKNFFDAQQNQIEIFQQLRTAFTEFTGLASFTGGTADSVDSYISEIHMNIVDTFNMALMELEIRLLTLRQDFLSSVDSSENAILDNYYIGDVTTTVSQYKSRLEDIEIETKQLIATIDDLVPLSMPPFSSAEDEFNLSAKKSNDVKISFEDYDANHANDMEALLNLFQSFTGAFQYMRSLSSPEGINYNAGDVNNLPWSQDLNQYQIEAYFYASTADPDFADTIYVEFAVQTGLTMLDALISPDADMSTIMDLLKNGNLSLKNGIDAEGFLKNASKATQEAIQIIRFFRNGIRFVPSINASGETVIKAVSVAGKALTLSQQVAAMRAAGVGEDLIRGTARSLASSLFSAKGLEITGESAYVLKNGAIDAKSITALTAAINAGDDAGSFMKAFAKELKGVSKAEWILGGVTIAIDVVDGFYDERTRKLSDFDGAKFAANVTVDTVSFLIPIATAAGVGAAWGSVVPGIGTAAGAVAGIIVACANLIKWGEPPQSLTDRASDLVEGVIHDVGNWFSKVFW